MRIHSLSKIIALPFGVAFALVLLYTMDFQNPGLSYWLIPLGVCLTMIFVFHYQIDFWWHKRIPPPIDRKIVDWLEQYSAYYKRLVVPDKIRFLKRLSIYLHAKEFSARGQKEENVPEDIKAIIGQIYIQISMGIEDYLLSGYDRIILYKHPFPTPLKKFLHSVETHAEDGVIILSLEQLISGLMHPQHYNVGLHAYAEAFILKNPHINFQEFKEDIWTRLESVSNMKMDRVNAILGFEPKDPLVLCINYFFEFPKSFKELEPNLFQEMVDLFKQDPLAPSLSFLPELASQNSL